MSYKENLSKLYPVLIISVGVLICSVLIKCSPEAKPEEIKRSIPIVDVMLVTPESMNVRIESQGTVIPRTESQIFPEISGKVVFVSPKLDAGSSFNKGDILLQIDPTDYELEIEVAEANLNSAQQEFKTAQKESDFEIEQWKQRNTGIAPEVLSSRPNIARSKVEAAEANLKRLKRNLHKTTIRAPYDGLVRKKNIDIGTVVGPGYLIANIYSIDYVEVKLQVPDSELDFLEIPMDGTEIKLREQPSVKLTGSFAGKLTSWDGNIVRIESEIDPQSRMATLVARVSDPYNTSIHTNLLKVGQFVNAEIKGRKYDDIYKIDRQYIRNNNQVVLVNRSDSTLVFKEVDILRYRGDKALINKGLRRPTLCLTNLDIMYDGMKIQLK